MPLQRQLVLDDHAGGVRTGVGPGALQDRGAAVTGVVVGDDGEPGVEQGGGQVQVPARVLPEAVDDLHDAADRPGRPVQPALDGVAAVGRCELDLVQGHAVRLSWTRRVLGDLGLGAEPTRGCSPGTPVRHEPRIDRPHVRRVVAGPQPAPLELLVQPGQRVRGPGPPPARPGGDADGATGELQDPGTTTSSSARFHGQCVSHA